jgi:uncharacterized membrane protein YjjP (DUF1212 family)
MRSNLAWRLPLIVVVIGTLGALFDDFISRHTTLIWIVIAIGAVGLYAYGQAYLRWGPFQRPGRIRRGKAARPERRESGLERARSSWTVAVVMLLLACAFAALWGARLIDATNAVVVGCVAAASGLSIGWRAFRTGGHPK